MSFRVRLRKSVRRQISGWHLPDGILVDVYLRLQDLSQNPAEKLRRIMHPFDGMSYTFMARDRSNRTYMYVFTFKVKYGADEETLLVERGVYSRIAV